MKMTLRKTHQAAAWEIRVAMAVSFFNRMSLVWLCQLQARISLEDVHLHQDVNKLVAALEYSSDATLNATKFASRALASNISSHCLLWLRHWQADMCSKWRLASAPFKERKLFGETLDPILVENKDKRKVLPSSHCRADRRSQPYFRRQSFWVLEPAYSYQSYQTYQRNYLQGTDRSQYRSGFQDR